jgi:Na+/H+-dicarboxylate symporter
MKKTGLTPLGILAMLLFVVLIFASFGCAHVPKGGASEVHASFGVPGVFAIEKNIAGVKVTQTKIEAATTDTTVQILLFTWKSSGKDIVLTNPAPQKTP